ERDRGPLRGRSSLLAGPLPSDQHQRDRADDRDLPRVQPRVRGRGLPAGGTIGYPLDRLFEEVAFVAYHFHWSFAEILGLEHGDRQRLIDEISAINRQLNENSAPSRGIPLELWTNDA